MTKKLIGMTMGVAMAAMLSVRLAAATTDTGTNAVICNPSSSADANRITYTVNGVQNNDGSNTANVDCPLTLNTSTFVTSVGMTVFDRHNVDNVCCTVELQDLAGGVIFTATPCTSGFQSASMSLSVSPNFMSSKGHLRCNIPRFHSTNGNSHLASYRVISTP